MKNLTKLFIIAILISNYTLVSAQESEATEAKKEEKNNKPVRSPFESDVLIDNQTIVVPTAKTLEFILQHRLGKTGNGIKDLYGFYGATNIRFGLSFSVTNRIALGFGTTKNSMLQDLYWKWAILDQTQSNSMPVAITYYGNAVVDAGAKEKFEKPLHRFSFFHQLMIARKIDNRFTIQIAPSFMHFNLVDTTEANGYPELKHDNFAITFSGRAKISPQSSFIFEYDHPLTTPEMIKPNLALGLEVATGAHAFQIFLGTYKSIVNQYNYMLNTSDYTSKDGIQFGFNMTRLWNF